MIYLKNLLNQTYGYWLITPNQKPLCIETNIFLTAGNYKSASGKLKNDSVNGAMLIKGIKVLKVFGRHKNAILEYL